MADHLVTLIVLGVGFLLYFLIITFGPPLYDLILNSTNEEASD